MHPPAGGLAPFPTEPVPRALESSATLSLDLCLRKNKDKVIGLARWQGGLMHRSISCLRTRPDGRTPVWIAAVRHLTPPSSDWDSLLLSQWPPQETSERGARPGT